jgi:lambda family phage portal protein
MAKLNFWQKLNPFRTVEKRRYEGAAKTKRMKNWFTSSGSANTEIAQGLVTLRDRSRFLVRNNPFAARAVQAISTNVVGKGIQTQFRSANANEIISPPEVLWKSWAQSKEFDFDNRHDIVGMQRIIMRSVAESGEVLIRKRYDKKLTFPIQYQILESDFLDHTKSNTNTADGNTIIQGIEFNKQGKRVAYWLYEAHPGGYDEAFRGAALVSNRVPSDQIIPIYRQDRPGQVRGVPWASPIIVRLKDLDDYEDAQLVRQKIAACFTAFVQDIGSDFSDEQPVEDQELSDKLEPGQIEFLPTGKTIQFASPPELANYDQFTKNVLRSIAAGYGLSYEVLTGDLSMVNFSSARLGWIEFQRNIDVWRKEIIIDSFLEEVVKDFKQIASIQGFDFSKYNAVHTPPKRELIDPTKELNAIETSIRNGLSTWSEELMAMGKDPQEHFAQYKKDQDLIDSLGLKLDSDARLDKLNPTQGTVIND